MALDSYLLNVRAWQSSDFTTARNISWAFPFGAGSASLQSWGRLGQGWKSSTGSYGKVQEVIISHSHRGIRHLWICPRQMLLGSLLCPLPQASRHIFSSPSLLCCHWRPWLRAHPRDHLSSLLGPWQFIATSEHEDGELLLSAAQKTRAYSLFCHLLCLWPCKPAAAPAHA